MKRLKVSATGFPLKTREIINLQRSLDFLERAIVADKKHGEVLNGMVQNTDGTVESGMFVFDGKIVPYKNTGAVGNAFRIHKLEETDLYNTNSQLSTALEELPINVRYFAELVNIPNVDVTPPIYETISKKRLIYYKKHRMIASGVVDDLFSYNNSSTSTTVVPIVFPKPIEEPYFISYTLRIEGVSHNSYPASKILESNANGFSIEIRASLDGAERNEVEWQIFER